jgi:imidazole glycerol-phosphate synthase subunit HisH
MNKVAIVDYGMGNVDSVARAVEEAGSDPLLTDKESDFEDVSSIILPGVGSFAVGMCSIVQRGLDKILARQVIKNKIPFLGICLGMQLLATTGYEGEKTFGLGWIEGEVVKFLPQKTIEQIPHVGWNEVKQQKTSCLFRDIPTGKDFYFVHSYHFIPRQNEDILALTSYCGIFVSALQKDNIFGVQFHPEKSLTCGLKLIRNFLLIHS